jgi:four helix bundle protein
MTLKFEELRILQSAEDVADSIWKLVVRWDPFARDIVGGQLSRAVDSSGTNIAEAFGRVHYGEKLQFLYYARGSLYESKYWINRAQERVLMTSTQVQMYATQLTELARQLNSFVSNIKGHRSGNQSKVATISESPAEYMDSQQNGTLVPLFSDDELQWIKSIPNI